MNLVDGENRIEVVVASSCRLVAPPSVRDGSRRRYIHKKMFFRGNELMHLLQLKDLANLTGKKRTVFEGKKWQNELKNMPKSTLSAALNVNPEAQTTAPILPTRKLAAVQEDLEPRTVTMAWCK